MVGDLTHDDQVQQLLETAQSLVGPIDILINNAGGSGGAKESWAETKASSWASAFDRNVLAALRATTRLLPAMREARWGRVINVSSLAAIMPPASAPDYSAAKTAINAMTASMAKAVAADGVTVNAISLGTIHSSTLEARFREVADEQSLCSKDAPWEEVERILLPMFAQVPVGRVGCLDGIASAVAFLASPIAGCMTGSNLRVDGGLSPAF